MALPIEDYAIIGDCRTAALVGKNGSIDWLCFPRFDSGACFAALLGTRDHGFWQIAPAGEIQSVTRRYRQGTLILETTFETADGGVRLVDVMPPGAPSPSVVRIVEGLRGTVRMKVELVIRFDYGTAVPWVRRCCSEPGVYLGIRATAGPDTVYVRSPIDVHGEDFKTVGEFTVSAGERVPFDLVWHATHEPEPPHRDPDSMLNDADAWWRAWSDKCTYAGEYREAVLRSLITLKALTYAPTGGIVAAATTSLPEFIGGVRNWDYRYCWLRDAAFTLVALSFGGYYDEAQAWQEWLVNAIAGAPQDMQIMYGVAGERRLTEMELPWLPGYENSRPVRVGNGAYSQRQLDVYGEVMSALYRGRRLDLPPTAEGWRVQRAMLRILEDGWKQRDEGIWEIRGKSQHFVHSKVMCWVAMDRAVHTVKNFGVEGELEKWTAIRDQIHAEVCEQGFDRELNSFVQYYGSKDPDASLLMLPLVGFLPATDPRMVGTVEYIQKRLVHDGFVERYPTAGGVDGLPPGEGSFLICSFWFADNLALQGRMEEAKTLLNKLLSLRNDVGLLAEEYDVTDKRLVGNFPQAFSHIGLINTVRILTEMEHGETHRV